MVVVVPAFAEGDESEDKAVAGIVVGLEATFAHEVGHRVDASGAVEEDGGADEETPDEQLRAVGAQAGGVGFEGDTRQEDGGREENRHDEVEAVEPDELGEFREVLDLGVIGREITAAGDPADVGPNETMDVGRVCVLGVVRVLVVVAVMVGPPE